MAMETLSDAGASRAIRVLDKLYEYERAPVPADKLQPARHFAALLAGEHVAGTEFVIGALFVAWGVRTYDVIVGLLLGNTLAVLTWTLVCVPIAIETRLTLYWYLRRIAGPVTTLIYNVLNAVLFCILAGCMITVSASSIRLLFGIPAQTKWYPEDARFVVLVLVLGAVVVTLAILGFKRLAQFAQVCAPWMFFMFLAGALALLPGLAAKSGLPPVRSWVDFWHLGDKLIWTGVAPDGRPSMSFWQVAAFAWICNLAMHAGLSDMALFRYAKTVPTGLTSAFGMFFGHYVAWICAGVMGAATALMLNKTLAELDAGAIAMQALGIAGAIAVVLAGWTTSNPTLYRAGLAFQAVTPGWPRWLVTLVAGIATTIVACFPFVFTQLLGFVGWYGLLLMPVGAIVFAEHWIFPRIGLTRYWAAHKGLLVSWPALLSWGIAIALAIVLERTGALHLFFLFIPIWALTIVLYTLLAAAAGAREKFPELAAPLSAHVAPEVVAPATSAAMRPARGVALYWISGIVALVSLLACIAVPIWFFAQGSADYDERLATFKTAILWLSLIHLVSATVWAIQKDKRRGGF
jgi:cytosine permease